MTHPADAGRLPRERDPEADRVAVDELVKWATLVVGTFAVENRSTLHQLPDGWAWNLLVEATVGFLIGSGLVESKHEDAPATIPIGWRQAIPDDLQPDPSAALVRYRLARERRG